MRAVEVKEDAGVCGAVRAGDLDRGGGGRPGAGNLDLVAAGVKLRSRPSVSM